MDVSIVIPTYNRRAFLARSVPALLGQQIPAGLSYEVIFVNNGSADDTSAYLATLVATYPEQVQAFSIAPSGGPAAPRNVGIRAARGEVIIILDDDVIPDPDLVARHHAYHRRHPEPEAAAVGQAYVPEELRSSPLSLFHEYSLDCVAHGGEISYIYFWTCNVSIKRAFLLRSGLFDERFLSNEDILLGYRLHQLGMRLRCEPSARGAHWHQFKREDLDAKAITTGRWIWAATEFLQVPEVLDRYGVLSLRLGLGRYLKRVVRRLAFRVANNPLLRGVLQLCGATNGKRSRLSDLYYYLRYRATVVAGYHQARRAFAHRRRHAPDLQPWDFVREMPRPH